MNNQALTATIVKDFTQHADPRSEHFCKVATFGVSQVRIALWQFILLGGSFNCKFNLVLHIVHLQQDGTTFLNSAMISGLGNE